MNFSTLPIGVGLKHCGSRSGSTLFVTKRIFRKKMKRIISRQQNQKKQISCLERVDGIFPFDCWKSHVATHIRCMHIKGDRALKVHMCIKCVRALYLHTHLRCMCIKGVFLLKYKKRSFKTQVELTRMHKHKRTTVKGVYDKHKRTTVKGVYDKHKRTAVKDLYGKHKRTEVKNLYDKHKRTEVKNRYDKYKRTGEKKPIRQT